MSANLIISLDCEGKWGLSSNSKLIKNFTNKNLLNVYKELNKFFSNFNIPVTYAFVGSFILNNNEKNYFECFENINKCYSKPLINFFNNEKDNKSEGWFVPEAYDLVNNEINEIGCHSFSHLSFLENNDENIIDKELNNCKLIEKLKKKKFKTFVFPYNEIAYTDKLKKYGFIGFRNHKRINKNIITKSKKLFDEWNILEHINYQNDFNKELDLVEIPGGFFFNWRFKWRRYLVPEIVTLIRWKRLIKYAVNNNKTLNLWFHPHNLLTAPSTFKILKEVIMQANKMRDNGKLNIITQAQYAENILCSKNS